MEMRPCLGMHRDDVRPSFCKGSNVGICRGNHQMDIKGQAAVWTQRLHHLGTYGDVGHEVPVHDVDMNVVGACLCHRCHFFAQTSEVGREEDRKSTRLNSSHVKI